MLNRISVFPGFRILLAALIAMTALFLSTPARAEEGNSGRVSDDETGDRLGANGLLTMGIALGYARIDGSGVLPDPQHGFAFQFAASYERGLPGTNINIGIRPQVARHDWGDFQGVDRDDLSLILYTADLMFLFPPENGHAVPYFFVGGGIAEYNTDVAGVDTTDTSGVFQVGAGFRGVVGGSTGAYFSPEISYMRDGSPFKGNNLRFTFGLGVYFD